MLLVGRRLEDLSMRELLDVAWAVWYDSYTGLVNPQELSNSLDEAMRNSWRDRETWGDSATTEPTAAMIEAQAQRLTQEERDERRRRRDEARARSG